MTNLNKPDTSALTEEIIQEWNKLQLSLAKIKAREMQLRKLIVSEITNQGTVGTLTKEFFGYELKAENKVSYSFVDKEALTEFLAGNPTEQEVQTVKFAPSVVVGKYNKLSSTSILKSSLVTVKPAAPSLKVISILE